MPYIEKVDRVILDSYIDAISTQIAKQIRKDGTLNSRLKIAGLLNYIFTKTTLKVMKSVFEKYSYWMFALVIGVMITVVLEIYRRVVVPYEKKKIKENGDLDVFEELTDKEEGWDG